MKRCLVLLLFLSIVSCGKSESGDEKVKIRYTFWDLNFVPAFEEMKKDFELENPNIEIVSEVVPWAQYWVKLEAGATGDSLADVAWINIANFPRFYEAGIIHDWDGTYGTNIDNSIKDYADAMKTAYQRDGKYYAFPKGMDTVGFYINKKLFEDANMPLPPKDVTWEEIEVIAEKLQPLLPANTYALGISADAQGGFLYFVHNMGGYLVSPDGKKSGLDLPQTIAGIEKFRSVQKAPYTPDYASYAETALYQVYSSGRVAMATMLSVYFKGYGDEILSNTIIHPLPKINGQNKTVLNSIGDIVSASSKNPEEAQKWVDYMNSDKALIIQATKGVFFPLNEKYIAEYSKAMPIDTTPFYQGVNTNSYPYPSTVEWGKFQDIYERAVRQSVETEDTNSIPTIMKDASDQAKKFL